MPVDAILYEQVKLIFTTFLEKKNLRKTPERYAILEEIYSRKDHFDVDQLFDSMIHKNYRVSRATVYNTIGLLIECDLVSRHQFGANTARYEKSHGFKQHDHLVCNVCKKVEEFCDPRIQHIQTTMGDLLNFQVTSHALILYGICEDCQKKNADEK